MTEKWFQFKCLFFKKDTMKDNFKTTVYAPTIKALREKAAIELLPIGIRPTYSQVDRGEVEISEDGNVVWLKTIMKKAIDGQQFTEEVLAMGESHV